ncbi:MAG: heterodisulfide reductase [Thermoplasmata archaeon]|nr:MAG: 4Fe-4S dicluster domain-containing protein [Thermoplasmata archaeon]RLF32791.1 MAG: heterodisulfide reductase [Thermoplasmata archaeon]RLF39295.1 MAG: heterodisulfide reductase [Thermoplasmata archaeon]RLF61015.1 MAG: heterodisulfide reductase [Thermoplasmata archaeon]HDN50276.1 4Fe-4S dicluster domain-containing protein [Thermoplasmatales archaeon]
MQIDEKNVNFLKKVEELSGEKITLCEQCGICTTSCPMVDEMDFTPAGIMRAVQIGDETIIESKAIWVCASCFSCTVRCPRGIDLSKVTEALRQLTLRKNVDHIDLKEVKKEKLPAIAVVSALRKFTG